MIIIYATDLAQDACPAHTAGGDGVKQWVKPIVNVMQIWSPRGTIANLSQLY